MQNLGVALFKMPCNVCWRNSNCTGPANNYLKLYNVLKQLQKCIHCVLGQDMRIGAILFLQFSYHSTLALICVLAVLALLASLGRIAT